jgi:TRAP-type C4-dicarboxylate transport system permease small subunit
VTDDWRPKTVLGAAEDVAASVALLAMVVLPLLEIVWRRTLGHGLPGSGPIVQHLTLWVGFMGAAMAARDGKLLALATGTFIPAGLWRRGADLLAAAFGACAAVLLAWGAYQMVLIERESGTTIGAEIPAWVAQLVLPVAFALIAIRSKTMVLPSARRADARRCASGPIARSPRWGLAPRSC